MRRKRSNTRQKKSNWHSVSLLNRERPAVGLCKKEGRILSTNNNLYSNNQEAKHSRRMPLSENSSFCNQIKACEQERSLIDSFESYYESEEENIDKYGRKEFSYIVYNEQHLKGSRRRERMLLEKVEQIEQQNSFLKLLLSRLQGRSRYRKTPSSRVTPTPQYYSRF